MAKNDNRKRANHEKVKIIPLGGLGEIGRNMTAIEYADEIIVTSSSKMARGVKTVDKALVGGKDEYTLGILRDALYSSYLNATNV